MARTGVMPEDRFFFPEDNGLNLQERGQAQTQYPLNESYYHSKYQFPTQEPGYTTGTHPRPRYKSEESRIEMGAVKATSKNRPSAQYRRERERALSNTPVEALIQRLITQEYEAKEGRKLLRTAITQLEALQRRATTAEEARRTLESGQTDRGLKIAESVMDAQEEAARAKYEMGLYRFQLEQAQREIRNKQHVVKAIEAERDNAEKSATKARALARQLNDERLIAQAREEGRRLGYAEGMRQGRMLSLTAEEGTIRRKHIADRPHQTPLGSGAAFIEEYDADTDAEDARPPQQTPDLSRNTNAGDARHHRHESQERGRFSAPRGPSPHTPQLANAVPSRTSTPAGDAVRQELDAAKARVEEMVRREAEQREMIRQWELREAERVREAELERVKVKEAELEHEKEEIREQEQARQREIESLLVREREKEKELERERNEERRIREERERELEQERQKVRELERERERERERDSNSSMSQRTSVRSGRLPYLRMPQPPPVVLVEPPSEPATAETPPLRIPPPRMPPPPIRVPHQQFQPYPYPRNHRRQPSSPDTSHSASSATTSMSNLDIITFPTSTIKNGQGEWERTNLSDIPEVPSIRSHSRTSASDAPPPSPTWLTNPPPDFTNTTARSGPDVDRWRRSTGNDPPDSATTSPNTPTGRDHLSPSFQPRGRANERSPYGHQPRASSGSTVEIRVEPPSRPPSSAGVRDPEAVGFLSPNSAPLVLVPEEPPADTRPVIPDMADLDTGTDLHNFPPPGFVPFTTPKNPSESESGSSGSRRHNQTGGLGRGTRLGASIYGNFTPPVQQGGLPASQSGGRQAPRAQTKSSIYANTPLANGQYSTSPGSKPQIYGPSSPSLSGPRPLQENSSRIHGRRPEARTQIYGPPSTSSSATSQTPHQIYAPTPPSLAGTRPLQSDPSRIYAAGGKHDTAAIPRRQIYAPTPPAQSQMSPAGASRSGPVIPPPPPGVSQSQIHAPVIPPSPSNMSRIYASASPATVPAPLGAVRSGPVVPPPVGSMTPRSRNVYPSATPAAFHPSLPGAGTGTAPLRARFSGIYADPEEDNREDEETRWNTQVSRVFGGSPNRLSQPPLPVPPPAPGR